MRCAVIPVFILMLFSCTEDLFIDVEQNLIVEGWIDADGFPVVILTESVIITDEYKEYSDLENYVIKWAKVTVSDGENEVVLTGKATNDYFPPYVYTTGRMRGVPGKTYKLTVEYKDYFAEAVTVIPERGVLDSIDVVRCEGSDSLCYLKAFFKDAPNAGDYYKFFTMVEGRDSFYLSSMQAVYDDALFTSEDVVAKVYSGSTLFDEKERLYFKKGERAFVKFARIDSASFRFWDMYKDVVAFSRNPFMPYSRNIPSNMEGAMGYWFGYGSTFYCVDIE